MADDVVPYRWKRDEEVFPIYREAQQHVEFHQALDRPDRSARVSQTPIKERGELRIDPTPERTEASLLAAVKEFCERHYVSAQTILTNDPARQPYLNKQVQDMRADAGELSWHRLTFGQETIRAGDRVIFPHENPALGITHNDIGTVRSIDLLRRQASVVLDADKREVFFSVRDKVSLHLAYVLTPEQAQHRTFQQTFVSLTGPTLWDDVQAVLQSPHRESADIFTDRRSIESATDFRLSVLPGPPSTPPDILGYLYDLQKVDMSLYDTLRDSQQALVTDWWLVAANNVSNTSMIAQTRELANNLNRLAQEYRAEELSAEYTVTVGTQTIHEKDRVMLTEDTEHYRKGDCGTVRWILPHYGMMAVRMDTGGDHLIATFGKSHGLQLAYCLTPQDLQGRTVGQAFFLMTHSLDHHYTQSDSEAAHAWATDQYRLFPPCAPERTTLYLNREAPLPEFDMLKAFFRPKTQRAVEREEEKFRRVEDVMRVQLARVQAALEESIEYQGKKMEQKATERNQRLRLQG